MLIMQLYYFFFGTEVVAASSLFCGSTEQHSVCPVIYSVGAKGKIWSIHSALADCAGMELFLSWQLPWLLIYRSFVSVAATWLGNFPVSISLGASGFPSFKSSSGSEVPLERFPLNSAQNLFLQVFQ